MANFRIADIIVQRDRDVEPLPDGLPKQAYTRPVILRYDHVLVDGLRRLRRAEARGDTEIQAVIAGDYLSLMAEVKRQNAAVSNQILPRRAYEFYKETMVQGNRWSRTLNNGGWDTLPDGHRVRRPAKAEPNDREGNVGSARALLVEALGAISNTGFKHIIFVYNRADTGDKHAQKLVALVDEGILTPQQARHQCIHPNGMRGHVVDVAEQQRVLERGSAGLAAQVAALVKLGSPIRIPADEVERHYDTLFAARGRLSSLMNGLRKVIKEAREAEDSNG